MIARRPVVILPALMVVLGACAPQPASTPTPSAFPTSTIGPRAQATPWHQLPVLPAMTETAREIYNRGLELGNNPAAFSKVGDCGSSPSWFLGAFDSGPDDYRLGEHQHLDEVIRYFGGSFGRVSLAAKSGFNASSVFSPLSADPVECAPGEGPLACEYRIHRPSIAFIMLGTNDRFHAEVFEDRLSQIVAYTIAKGVVPILATKPDNLEGDGSLNATVARVARAYDVPLWNEWRAMQSLPDGGLQEDGAHLTWEPNWFDDRVILRAGWPVRNLTALQALDVVWRYVTSAEDPTATP
ncbi:MAG TPA: SGNH/GDSL hydrolase family protein [Anaerolineales bacterium]|nr:SGNH/GDSL hydrolase family protein [Anaerolineales bacterium]